MRGLLSVSLILSLAMTQCQTLAVDYLEDVKPLLETKCYACHGAVKQEADLRLETRELMLQGFEVVVPGDANQSQLLHRVSSTDDDRMPPPDEGSPLKPHEIDLIRKWIDSGAEAPHEPIPVAPSEHWAFQKIIRPAVPDVGSTGTDGKQAFISSVVRNDAFALNEANHLISDRATFNVVDQFLEAERRKNGLRTQSAAPRSIAIRRLYLDLVGLPPTVEQLRDDRPWEEIVDELLCSPQHGESVGQGIGWTSGVTATGTVWVRSCETVRNICGTGETGSSAR
ncbi:MAG: c-type cytochrome domain-containing protein [Pirellulaceae bacterium]